MKSNERGTTPLLRCSNISKSFGGVKALKQVSLDIYPGEVHGLIGANGAGKSTLIKIISGDILQDSGELVFNGAPLSLSNPQDAYKLGFSFIHQELNLVPKFSIIENLTLGMEKETRFGLINWKAVVKKTSEVLARIGLDLPLDTIVETLSVADQWLVSIAHALMRDIKMICMDEPTASLSAEESKKLFAVIENLTAKGVAVLYVSHRLDEIMDLCSGISVFKDGECVLTTERSQVTRDALVTAIVGRKGVVCKQESLETTKGDAVVFSAQNLSWEKRVDNVSFELHEGEVIGFAGLVGAGRTELANLIFGVEKPDSGKMVLDGKEYRPNHVADAIEAGIGLVPEERRSQGLILKDTVNFNLNMLNLKSVRISRFFSLLNNKKMVNISRQVVDRLQVKTPSVNTAVINLSGGNQQKVVIGKWVTRDLRVLILDEPSRGVDVGARSEIHKKIRELAKEGKGMIVISSDNEELPFVCDVVYIMAEGKIVGKLEGEEITKEAINYKSYEHVLHRNTNLG